MKSINTLVIQKMSKLKYLKDRFATNVLKTSIEYSKLSECADIHKVNSNKFIESLRNYTNTIDVISDSFLENEKLYNLNFSKYDLIFSLGGDGTFLRIAQFINNNEQVLIGVNTDQGNSYGYYCPVNSINKDEVLEKVFSGTIKYKYFNKLEVWDDDKVYYFMNDLYFGEKFLGRVSKYCLEVDEKHCEIVKSSGIIFSTCKLK